MDFLVGKSVVGALVSAVEVAVGSGGSGGIGGCGISGVLFMRGSGCGDMSSLKVAVEVSVYGEPRCDQ